MSQAPEPRANPDLLGQEAAESALAGALRGGRLHHAWLLTGAEGVGKATLAFRFARRLLARPAADPNDDSLALDPAHPVFHRVAAGSHADLITLARAYDEKRRRLQGEIRVEEVRAASAFLRLTPAEGGWRVVVIDGAEHLNRNAANALLKLLEEPPPRALLLLACAAPGRLLPTIRSRCRQLRLAELPEAIIERLLARYCPDLAPAERATLAGLAEGSIGRAVLLGEEQGGRIADLVAQTFSALPALDAATSYRLSDALLAQEQGFTTYMEMLRARLAQLLRQAAGGSGAPGSGPDSAMAPLAGQRPLAEWVGVWQALGRLQSDTERFNLDKRQALLLGFGLLRGP